MRRSYSITRQSYSATRQGIPAKRHRYSYYPVYGLMVLVMLGGWGCEEGHTHTEISGPFVGKYENTTSAIEVCVLHDGTQVVLSPKSKVEMDSGFDKGNRDVRLDGDASFIVTRAGSPAFFVHTRNLHIEVVGTGQLHVDAFASSPGEQADLLTGKLRVSKSYHSSTDSTTETLESGDMVMINRDIDLMEKEKMNAKELDEVKRKF